MLYQTLIYQYLIIVEKYHLQYSIKIKYFTSYGQKCMNNLPQKL